MIEGCIVLQTIVLFKMVRNYKRQTTRVTYGDDRITRALDAVKAGHSIHKASGRLIQRISLPFAA